MSREEYDDKGHMRRTEYDTAIYFMKSKLRGLMLTLTPNVHKSGNLRPEFKMPGVIPQAQSSQIPGPWSKSTIKQLHSVFDSRAVHFVVDYQKSHANYIVDADGNELLDVYAQIASIPVGYNNPTLIKAATSEEMIQALVNRPAIGNFPSTNWISQLKDIRYIFFTVKDTGPGLTTAEMENLFARFKQASPRTHAQYGGSGLGLFISRELAEMHGGNIGLSSKAGEGSTFSFYVKTYIATTHADDTAEILPATNGESEATMTPIVTSKANIPSDVSP